MTQIEFKMLLYPFHPQPLSIEQYQQVTPAARAPTHPPSYNTKGTLNTTPALIKICLLKKPDEIYQFFV